MPRTFLHWSSGKDSALTLWTWQQAGQQPIDRLLTTMNRDRNRVSMHGLPQALLTAQARSIGLPLTLVDLPEHPDLTTYRDRLWQAMQDLKQQGYTDTVLGDIFLEDLRAYREALIAPTGLRVHFPLWKKDTRSLADTFIREGFRAIVICVDAQVLPAHFCGRYFDASFLADLPESVDPCGENGEFHTFCFDGPIFPHPVAFTSGERIFRPYPPPVGQDPTNYGFWYLDLHP